MAYRAFSALGFDPAPGDPATLSSAAEGATRSAATFRASGADAHALATADWDGPAGEAFRAASAELPRHLETARSAHTEVAAALTEYQATLAGLQRRAAALEDEAARLRAGGAHTGLFGGDPALRHVERLAVDVRHEQRTAADAAARRIRAAAETVPIKEPGLLDRIGQGIKNWVTDHEEGLRRFSDLLGKAAMIAGAVAFFANFVPGVGQAVAGVAMIFGAVAGGMKLGLDAGLKLTTGKGSWTQLGLDAAMMFLPAGAKYAGKALVNLLGDALPGAGALVKLGKGTLLKPAVSGTRTGPVPWKEVAGRVPGGKLKAVYRRSTTDDEALDAYSRRYRGLDTINRPRYELEKADDALRLDDVYDTYQPGGFAVRYDENCVDVIHQADRALDGLPYGTARPGAVERSLDPWQLAQSHGGRLVPQRDWDGVVKHVNSFPPSSHGVVTMQYRGEGGDFVGHAVKVVREKEGPVFLDYQNGWFAGLRTGEVRLTVNMYSVPA